MDIALKITLTGFERKVYEIVKEFKLNGLDCFDHELLLLMNLPLTYQNFERVHSAAAKIKYINSSFKAYIYSGNNILN